MTFKTKLIYTAPVTRQAVFGFWRRRLGKSVPIAIISMALVLVWLILENSESEMIVPLGVALVTCVLMLPALPLSLYFKLMRTNREVEELDGGNLSVDESTFTATSRVASSTYDWVLVKEVWQFPDVWLLLFSKMQFLIFPTACMPPEMQALILKRVRAAGGKVS